MELGFAGISSREILQPTPSSTHMEEAHGDGRQNATLLDSLSIFAKRMKAAGITPRDPIGQLPIRLPFHFSFLVYTLLGCCIRSTDSR